MEAPESDSRKAHSKFVKLIELIRLPQETLILWTVSLLDVLMTYRLLMRGDVRFVESNPFAGFFLDRWGLEGMVWFKIGMTFFVSLITQIVARKDLILAKRVLGLSTLIILGVVMYSVVIHFNHGKHLFFRATT